MRMITQNEVTVSVKHRSGGQGYSLGGILSHLTWPPSPLASPIPTNTLSRKIYF